MGWIWKRSENSVPGQYQLTQSRPRELSCLILFVCLLCSLFCQCLLVFVLCQQCWVSDMLCDVKYLCCHRGYHPPMRDKGKNEAIGKRNCRQNICGGVGWQRAMQCENLTEKWPTKCWAGDSECTGKTLRLSLCACDANRGSPTEGEAWDVGKIARTDRAGWWAHLS